MQIVISTRHGEISDDERATAEEQCAGLTRYESRLSRVELTLTDEKNRWEGEALASVDRADPVHARAEGGDPRTVVDRLVDRMARQLKKLRERHTDHQAPPAGATPEDRGEEAT